MGARNGSGCQFLWRFFLCCATGWFGIDALKLYLKLRNIDVLRDGPYNPNITLAYLIAGSAGTFLFCWVLLTIPSVMNAHGGALIVLAMVDFAAVMTCSVALGLQGHFLPHEESQCGYAPSWQVSDDTPSLFAVLVDSGDFNRWSVYSLCVDRTKSWRWGIAVMVCFGIVAACNINFGIRELGRSSCYWIHDHKGKRLKRGCTDVCMRFPLYAIEYMLEFLWRLVPTSIRLKHRYTRRHDARKQRVRRYERQLTKELGPALLTRLKTGNGPTADSETVTQPQNENEKSREAQVTETSEKTSIHDTNTEPSESTTHSPPENIFERLPWHLIVNDILPYFHHVDIVNLLLTSRSTYRAIIPNGETDRAIVLHQICQAEQLDDVSIKSEVSDADADADLTPPPSHCFGCAIPVCSSCSTTRGLAESPSTIHSRTCRAVCSTCFRAHLSKKPRYYDRRDIGPCICGHNTFIFAPEVREEPVPDDEDTRPVMACWSTIGEGGMFDRTLCRECTLLPNSKVKKKREERHRNHRTIVRDVDGPGNKQAYECSQCLTLQLIPDKKKPVMFFLCRQCDKECPYKKHDAWLVGDVYRRQAQRLLLPSGDCVITIDGPDTVRNRRQQQPVTVETLPTTIADGTVH